MWATTFIMTPNWGLICNIYSSFHGEYLSLWLPMVIMPEPDDVSNKSVKRVNMVALLGGEGNPGKDLSSNMYFSSNILC